MSLRKEALGKGDTVLVTGAAGTVGHYAIALAEAAGCAGEEGSSLTAGERRDVPAVAPVVDGTAP